MTAPLERPADTTSAVERSLRLLRFVAEGGSTRNVSEAARRIGVNRVTLMRLIATLEQAGMLVAADDAHRLGVPFLTLAAAALGASDLMSGARDVLPEVAATTQLSAYLVIRERHEIVYSLAAMPDTPLVSQIRVGSRLPAYRATPGLALLARLEADEVARMCETAWDEADAPDPATLSLRLQRIRTDGCAWSHATLEAGIDSCAVPIVGRDGQAIAALSVAGPSQRFPQGGSEADALAIRLKTAAQQIAVLAG